MSENRPISMIARDISKAWSKKGKGINYAAAPYLRSMLTLNNITDTDWNDSARSVVTYFLANASGFRGDDAKRLKTELKTILKG